MGRRQRFAHGDARCGAGGWTQSGGGGLRRQRLPGGSAGALVDERDLSLSPDASGILTSGGSVANLVGLAAAREARLGTDQVRKGLAGAPPATLCASSEVHASVLKAAKLMGLGEDGVRLVPVDARFRIQLPRLRERLRQDRDDGRCPFAVVGTQGRSTPPRLTPWRTWRTSRPRRSSGFMSTAPSVPRPPFPRDPRARGGDGAGRLAGLRLPQVDARSLRGRLRPGP